MCGIAGSVNFKMNYSEVDDVMHHRGPDEQNGFAADNVDLFHLRLSILDIAGGKQPMQLDGRYTIIFNGEIYNHHEVRIQQHITGHTSSDTETLLLLYRSLGHNFLHLLDGMFVFAIYDSQEKKLFIARDRAGKKPLYYYNDGEKIVFASELNCIQKLLPLQMEEKNFYQYLRLGSFYKKGTPYKNVAELPGGSFLEIDCTACIVKETKWWDVAHFYQQSCSDSLATAIEKVDSFLHAGVKRRIESSDLEVGCFLSGGIDSGLIAAIASQYNDQLKTFTVSFAGEYDEAPLAKKVAQKYGTRHTEIKILFDHLRNDVEKIICNYGEPFFDSSAIPSYYISEEAKKHLTVILNGDGADELFGGYRRYVPFAQYDFFKSGRVLKNVAAFTKKILPEPDNKKSFFNYAYRLASLASKENVNVYLSAGVDIFEGYEQHFIQAPAGYMDEMQADFKKIVSADISGLKKIMNLDFDMALFNDLLVKMDIATMASSLEGRSPFLCKELLEYVPGMHDYYKINGTTTKFILRQLAKKYLPQVLVNQPKRGFEIPLKDWVENELKEIIFDYLQSSSSLSSQMVDRKFICGLLYGKQKLSAEKRAKMLWTLFSMDVWYRNLYKS